jgi:16S rRNA (cytidine1402-2'-O)-methyltransferase
MTGEPTGASAGENGGGQGRLYLVATPIGNLEDITLRALRVLREAHVIACEDTRQTRKLLERHRIDQPLLSYHEHNERERAAELIERLEAGESVALVSDAGMPLVSDPGRHLVGRCIERGIRVVPIPGPSAILAALAASGLETEEFLFAGFLPARAGERGRRLLALAGEPRTLVFYEAPHRLAAALRDALEILGDRRVVVARELTKIHEEFRRGRLSELAAEYERSAPRGEITLLIAPAEAAAPPAGVTAVSLAGRVAELQGQGLDRKAALKQAARERGMPKREAYRQLLLEEDRSRR